MDRESTRGKSKVHRTSAESWFYKSFIKKTVNDDFFTPAEILAKKSNQEIIAKVKKIKIPHK